MVSVWHILGGIAMDKVTNSSNGPKGKLLDRALDALLAAGIEELPAGRFVD